MDNELDQLIKQFDTERLTTVGECYSMIYKLVEAYEAQKAKIYFLESQISDTNRGM